MPVDPQRRGDVRVPEPLGDHLRVHAGEQQPRGVRVPQGVERHARPHAQLAAERRELRANRVGQLPSAVPRDQRGAGPERRRDRLGPLQVPAHAVRHLGCQADVAVPTALGPLLPHGHPAHLDHGRAHVERRAEELRVAPGEPAALPAPEAGVERQPCGEGARPVPGGRAVVERVHGQARRHVAHAGLVQGHGLVPLRRGLRGDGDRISLGDAQVHEVPPRPVEEPVQPNDRVGGERARPAARPLGRERAVELVYHARLHGAHRHLPQRADVARVRAVRLKRVRCRPSRLKRAQVAVQHVAEQGRAADVRRRDVHVPVPRQDKRLLVRLPGEALVRPNGTARDRARPEVRPDVGRAVGLVPDPQLHGATVTPHRGHRPATCAARCARLRTRPPSSGRRSASAASSPG